jgi:hypothetical protein
MMKRYQSVLMLLCLMAAFGVSSANASTSFDLVGAADIPAATGTPSPTGTPGLGGGLFLAFGLGQRVALELGGLYLTRNYNDGASSNAITMISGDLGLRLKLARVLYLVVGAYGNGYLTNPEPLTGTDYGVLGGVGIHIPFSPTVALMVRGDYHYALNALSGASGATITPSEIIATAGLSFGMNMLSK